MRDIRTWLGLSLSQLAREIPKTRGGRMAHVSRSFVCMVQRGQGKFLPAQMAALINLVTAELRDLLRRDVVVKIMHNSPWHVRVFALCVECGRSFELQRKTIKRCRRCRSKDRGQK